MLAANEKVNMLDPINSARPNPYIQLAMQLQMEHIQLKVKCSTLCELSIRTTSSFGRYGSLQLLKELRCQAESLLHDLALHSKWEDEELFPTFSRYYRRTTTEQTLLPSLWVLEKDHELALQFFESFLQLSLTLIAPLTLKQTGIDPSLFEKLKESCDHLTQGCLVLNGHFQMEEEIIFPLFEQILTDMDYFFS